MKSQRATSSSQAHSVGDNTWNLWNELCLMRKRRNLSSSSSSRRESKWPLIEISTHLESFRISGRLLFTRTTRSLILEDDWQAATIGDKEFLSDFNASWWSNCDDVTPITWPFLSWQGRDATKRDLSRWWFVLTTKSVVNYFQSQWNRWLHRNFIAEKYEPRQKIPFGPIFLAWCDQVFE